MKGKSKKGSSNAGRKSILDKKIPVVLLVEKSKIVGEDHLDLDVKSEEFKTKMSELKSELYESIDFIRSK